MKMGAISFIVVFLVITSYCMLGLSSYWYSVETFTQALLGISRMAALIAATIAFFITIGVLLGRSK